MKGRRTVISRNVSLHKLADLFKVEERVQKRRGGERNDWIGPCRPDGSENRTGGTSYKEGEGEKPRNSCS